MTYCTGPRCGALNGRVRCEEMAGHFGPHSAEDHKGWVLWIDDSEHPTDEQTVTYDMGWNLNRWRRVP